MLADVECDAVITDPPYDERTHAAAAAAARRDPSTMTKKPPSGLLYDAWTDGDVKELCAFSNKQRGWSVIITNHRHARVVEEAAETAGRYCFAPLAWVAPGSRVRLVGDGPSNWTCWVVVARPKTREFASWGALPGAYVETNRDIVITGGKPLALMRSIIRDYSRPGDLICDPCAGGGTTLLAAIMEGRRAIGSEMDPKTFQIAVDRLRGWGPMHGEVQPNLFAKQVTQ